MSKVWEWIKLIVLAPFAILWFVLNVLLGLDSPWNRFVKWWKR